MEVNRTPRGAQVDVQSRMEERSNCLDSQVELDPRVTTLLGNSFCLFA